MKEVILIYGEESKKTSSISRNKTVSHQLDGQGQLASIWNFSDTDWKKVKSETFGIFSNRCGSLKSLPLIFHDRDLTSDGEKERIALSHDSRMKSHNHISWEIQVWSWKSLNNQDLIPVSEMLKQVNQVAVTAYWHIRQTSNDGKKDKIRSTRIACCRIWNGWQYEIYYFKQD